MATMEALSSEFTEAMQQLYQQYTHKLKCKDQIEQVRELWHQYPVPFLASQTQALMCAIGDWGSCTPVCFTRAAW